MLWPGCLWFEIDPLQDLWTSMLAELDTLGHLFSPVSILGKAAIGLCCLIAVNCGRPMAGGMLRAEFALARFQVI
ncbi:hypothetical protein GCM10009504_00540 [Pseudomonas laurentiana]|nr:hypothetical protein GCM10009504_00540 [Pseudomonas laurentiana]